MTSLELKLIEALSALHVEVESRNQQLKEEKLVGDTGLMTVRDIKIEAPKLKELC